MRCIRCQANNREGHRYCSECGAVLAPVCPACGFSGEAGEKFCGACGTSFGGVLPPKVTTLGEEPTLSSLESQTHDHRVERTVASQRLSREERIRYTRARNLLRRLGIKSPEALRALPVARLLDQRQIGEGTVEFLTSIVKSGDEEQMDLLFGKLPADTSKVTKDSSQLLTDREVEVLALRYSQEGQHLMSLEEIAASLGVSVGYIRSLHDRAVRKLKRARARERSGHSIDPRAAAQRESFRMILDSEAGSSSNLKLDPLVAELTNPPSPDLDKIEGCYAKARPENWELSVAPGTAEDYWLTLAVVGVPRRGYHLAASIVDFLNIARTEIPLLLAELRWLRAQLHHTADLGIDC